MTGVTAGGPTFLGRLVPPSFRRTVVVIAPGAEHPYDPAEWAGAIVAVEAGEVWLDGEHVTRLLVRRGAVLWLDSVGLRALCNDGPDPAVLVTLRRWGECHSSRAE